MKYIINIPRNLLEEIRKILNKKEYNNINELVITALENQISLEESEIIEEDLFTTVMRMPKTTHRKEDEIKIKKDVFEILTLKQTNNIKTLPKPTETDLNFPNVEYKDSWLWGQINRIFPIKVALRVLLNMQNENKDFIDLNQFKIKAGEIAKLVGHELAKIDEKQNRKRDKKVSTALPIGLKEDKALARFYNHFLAFRRADNILDGALARFKFVNIITDKENKQLIGLTNEGLQFAKINNSIFDDDLYANSTLSDEEKSFYLNHVKQNVPEELNPLKNILGIISKGNSTVTEIDDKIREIKQNWTDTTITTQRSGTLGRLFELGLVEKIKKGVNVDYELSKNETLNIILEDTNGK